MHASGVIEVALPCAKLLFLSSITGVFQYAVHRVLNLPSRVMREQNDQQTRVLYEMCTAIIQILRSPPFPNVLGSSSSSSSLSSYRTTYTVFSPSGFASLFLAISLALMMFGSVVFVIGFILMPWIVGLVLMFYFVAIVSNLSELARSILCPTTPSSKDIAGGIFSWSRDM